MYGRCVYVWAECDECKTRLFSEDKPKCRKYEAVLMARREGWIVHDDKTLTCKECAERLENKRHSYTAKSENEFAF